jgi:hypothetical protein
MIPDERFPQPDTDEDAVNSDLLREELDEDEGALEAASDLDPDEQVADLEEDEIVGEPRSESFGFGDPAD